MSSKLITTFPVLKPEQLALRKKKMNLSMTEKKWFHINNVNEIDSPALLVYPDRVKANIQMAIQMTGDINRLRPHIKTHKCAEVAKLMMDAGIYKLP